MELTLNNLLIFFVGGSAAFVAFHAWRDPVTSSRGWVPVGLVMLALLALAFALIPEQAGYAAAALWLVFGIVPSLGFRAANRRTFRGDYDGSQRLLRLLRWLHPIEHWDWQETLHSARKLALRGELAQARAILDAYPTRDQVLLIANRLTYYEWSRDWAGLVEWYRANPVPATSRMAPRALGDYLRALGQTGELNELLSTFVQHWGALHAIPMLLQQAYLFVFAFCGRVELCRQVLDSGSFVPLKDMDQTVRDLWLAAASYAAGDTAGGQRLAEPALASGEYMIRTSATHLIEQSPLPAAEILTPESRQILERIEGDWLMFHTASRVLA